MEHKFIRSNTDALRCGIAGCGRSEFDHSANAQCESCPNTGHMNVFGDMLLCRECIDKEMKTALDHQTPDKQAARLASYQGAVSASLDMARQLDSAIEVRTDLFNAATVSIQDLKAAIDADASIENKNYKLAEVLKERYVHFKDVIFKHQEIVVDAANNQKAIQQEMNTLANKLRAEEREKLQLADITYKASAPKTGPKISKPKVKADKSDIKRVALELGVGEYMVAMICTAKGCSPDEAANVIRRSIGEAKSQVIPPTTEPNTGV